MKRLVPLYIVCMMLAGSALAQEANDTEAVPPSPALAVKSKATDPFAFGDFTWLNGNDRRHQQLLVSKYFTGSFMLDANYNRSNNDPIDHTVVGSTIITRDNEVQVAFASIGGDFNYENIHARIITQLGTRATALPRNDYSVYRGQYDLADAYRYISEAYGGYHWDVWHGINLDMGMFLSYVGLMSYYTCENWVTQPSFTSDNTPWFFNGVRLQVFPTDKFKQEIWLINGWQSYGMFNSQPGIGGQTMYRPKEYLSLVSNNYYGADAANDPATVRFHTDNSVQVRYFQHLRKKGITKAAFSTAVDLGFQNGGGVSAFGGPKGPPSNFFSGMFYHRLWFNNDHMAWTVGGGFIHNPSRYLVLVPPGDASALPNQYNPTQTTGTHPFTYNPSDKFDAWDCSTNFDFMPNDFLTWRIELVHREASVPYFAGPGGVTSPSGYTTTPAPATWSPDLVRSESRVILNLLIRF